jgi:hypothetical protein
MTRDKTHEEQIERWAEFVRDNPTEWKAKLVPFIDGQILLSRRFYEKLTQTPEGMQTIKELRRIPSV